MAPSKRGDQIIELHFALLINSAWNQFSYCI